MLPTDLVDRGLDLGSVSSLRKCGERRIEIGKRRALGFARRGDPPRRPDEIHVIADGEIDETVELGMCLLIDLRRVTPDETPERRAIARVRRAYEVQQHRIVEAGGARESLAADMRRRARVNMPSRVPQSLLVTLI